MPDSDNHRSLRCDDRSFDTVRASTPDREISESSPTPAKSTPKGAREHSRNTARESRLQHDRAEPFRRDQSAIDDVPNRPCRIWESGHSNPAQLRQCVSSRQGASELPRSSREMHSAVLEWAKGHPDLSTPNRSTARALFPIVLAQAIRQVQSFHQDD